MKDLPVIVQRVARSVVGVRAGRSTGCAFAAIGNGVLVTSQQVVGFEREVLLLLDDERVVPATVLRVNVALDVALLLPAEPIGLLPLDSVQEPPAVGSPCAVVGKSAGAPLVIATHVSAVDRLLDGRHHLEVGGPVDPPIDRRHVGADDLLLYTSPSPRDLSTSRMPAFA